MCHLPAVPRADLHCRRALIKTTVGVFALCFNLWASLEKATHNQTQGPESASSPRGPRFHWVTALIRTCASDSRPTKRQCGVMWCRQLWCDTEPGDCQGKDGTFPQCLSGGTWANECLCNAYDSHLIPSFSCCWCIFLSLSLSHFPIKRLGLLGTNI